MRSGSLKNIQQNPAETAVSRKFLVLNLGYLTNTTTMVAALLKAIPGFDSIPILGT